jgi:iron-sulfur cluster repair protein YtfE (RIC family)
MSTTETHPAWPQQIRLAGQTAAHPGPVDMSMMYVMHHAFRRDLAAFSAAARVTPAADRKAWAALAGRWALFAGALHHHHSGEDRAIWPLLLERTDDTGRATLRAMEDEHAEIDPILEVCAAGFERLAHHADEDARAALAVRLASARERLADHLRHEETEAIAIIQRVLTAEEWQRLDEEELKPGIPFAQLLALVPWAVHEVPAATREHLFAQPGGAVHRVLWLLTRGRFRRREQIAFRHRA